MVDRIEELKQALRNAQRSHDAPESKRTRIEKIERELRRLGVLMTSERSAT